MTFFYMGSGLFVFFLLLVLGVALVFVPSIIATTNEDGFEAVFQSFSIATGQPWRIIGYGAVVCAIELLAFVLMAFSVKEAWFIYSFIFESAMGEKFMELGQQALYYAQYSLAVSRNWIDYAFGDAASSFYFARDFTSILDMSVWGKICAYIFAIFMLFTGGLVVSFAEATGNSGLTLMYLIMRKKHDGENLLERKDEEEEDEEVEAEEEKKEEETTEAKEEEKKPEPVEEKKEEKPKAKKEKKPQKPKEKETKPKLEEEFYDVKLRKKVKAVVMEKVKYGEEGKERYAFRAKTDDGRNLTKFVKKERWEKTDI
jgi:hypothetical protein